MKIDILQQELSQKYSLIHNSKPLQTKKIISLFIPEISGTCANEISLFYYFLLCILAYYYRLPIMYVILFWNFFFFYYFPLHYF